MITAIVAVDGNWGIGKNGNLLVHIPDDLKRFKKITNNSTVIMGRKTWNSLNNKSLPNRVNYVISRSYQKSQEDVKFITLADAMNMISNFKNDNIFIIGGGQIYEEFLPYCDCAYITKIYKSFESDTFFPNLDNKEEWEITEKSSIQNYKETVYQYLTYRNKNKQEVMLNASAYRRQCQWKIYH